jgi:adenine-specific DNA-methyltransferase
LSIERDHDTRDQRPIEHADRLGAEIVGRKSATARKAGGLYLTPTRVAEFMARLVDSNRKRVRLLDPAAGSGTLSCAVVQHLALANDLLQEIDLVAYETDPDLQDALDIILGDLKRWAAMRGIKLRVRLEKRDFILANSESLKSTGQLFDGWTLDRFDIVIANPPYFKIPKFDRRAQGATAIVYGQPNIYALFMAASSALLHKDGEFVFITPRSFASGPYFRLFRERFFHDLRPLKIHLFGSRRDTFGRDEVLQENMILKGIRDPGWLSRGGHQFELEISSSGGIADLDRATRRTLPVETVFDMNTPERVLRLPILETEDKAMRLVDSWKGSLHQYGMNISTGPVVPFRATEFLVDTTTPATSHMPLIWMNHVHAMRISFPNGGRKPQYIERSSMSGSLLLPNRNYVLLRRFSAKEEAHRLVAAPWLRNAFSYAWLGIENHLNYIHRPGGELGEDECLGLAAILNSELLDTYFRISSGNTQVSATELRAMPLPSLEKIKLIGQRVEGAPRNAIPLDELLKETLGASV